MTRDEMLEYRAKLEAALSAFANATIDDGKEWLKFREEHGEDVIEVVIDAAQKFSEACQWYANGGTKTNGEYGNGN